MTENIRKQLFNHRQNGKSRTISYIIEEKVYRATGSNVFKEVMNYGTDRTSGMEYFK